MIQLTKMNGEEFLINHQQIECIELIPDCKVVMMNHSYYIVKDKAKEIVDKILSYDSKILDIRKEITIKDNTK